MDIDGIDILQLLQDRHDRVCLEISVKRDDI